MDIDEAIYSELSGITGLKVFPSVAQQDTETPYLCYELSSSSRDEVLQTGHNGPVEAHYQLDFYESKFQDLKALEKLIITEIKTWNLTNLGTTGPLCEHAEIMDVSTSYSDTTQLYVGTIELKINYQE